MSSYIRLVGAAVLWVGASSTAVAYAQTTSVEEDPAVSGDIIVTAQRFEQRLQDVPLSVTAVTGEELQSRNVTSLSDLQYAVPGLSTVEYGPGIQYLQVRGIANAIGASTVGIYLDEMPLTQAVQGNTPDVRLLDIERVEVLRGPQATLYGENSMGGTIRYIARSPDLGTVGGSVEAEYSSTNDGGPGYQMSGVLNLPLVTDKLGVRLVAGYEKIGGWIDGAGVGGNNVNDATIKTLRAKFLAKPTEAFTLSLLGIHQESDQDNQNFGVNRRTTAVVSSPNNQNYDLVQGVGDYDFGPATFTAVIGYFDNRNLTGNDVSPFYVPFLTAPPPFGFGLPVGFITEVGLQTDVHAKSFYSELRVASGGEGRLGWIIGGNYRSQQFDLVSSASTAPGTLPLTVVSVVQNRSSKSISLFGEARYEVASGLNLLAGLRYFTDRQRQTSNSINFGFPSVDDGKDTFHSLNPRLNISYQLSRTSLFYANIAKGFRSGGFNLTSAGGGVFAVPPTYTPDKLWTYEVGTKHQLAGGRIDVDVSGYYTEWQDVQSSGFAPGSAIVIVDNSGQVSGWGADASITARPARGLTLTGTYGWNNLAYDETTADKVKGDPVDYAVRESYSAALDYRLPVLNKATGFIRLDYQHAGRSQIALRNLGGQIVNRPSRDLVNARVGMNIERLEVSLFASNLFDEDAPQIVGPFGVLSENVEQRPRTMGISAKLDF